MSLLDRLQAILAGSYRVERELGRGGMAIVFLGHDLRHNRDVAIKVLRPDLGLALSPERFLREIQIAAQLQHPMILPLFDSGEADLLFYYVMPFVVGESLRDRLRREKRLPLDDAVQIGREVAEALHYAHAHGVVHRDIKPENILLSGGHPLVADFGVARALSATGGEHLTGTGLILGTPCYMSPEQAIGDPNIDGRSDIYSLGCVVYEMIGGNPPFSGPSAQAIVAGHLGTTIPSLTTLCPTVPAALRVTIETALAKEPANRFQTSLEFAEALANPRPAKRRRRLLDRSIRRSIVAAIGGIALVAGAWGAWSVWGRAERLDPNLLAVAPFEVIGTGAEIWREGVVDLLSRNLDGAGPLRVVSPAVVLRNWKQLADAASAQRLGRRTGAGLCVVGSVVPSGRDSVVLSASVLDVGTGETLGDVRVGGTTSRIDLAVDSLTMALLGAMGRTRTIGAVQLASVHSASLPALKAYLQGEQYFRRAAWDSAEGYFERAAELDPGFALAFHRIFETRGFPTPGNDSLVWTYALRAGALNRGLALRESLLVAADSMLAPIMVGSAPDTMTPHSVSRALTTLQVAARQFPNDAEVWYQLGKARSRFGWIVGVTPRQALEPLNRSISLDSAFAPGYVEAIQIAMVAQGPEATERYLAAYLRLKPTGRPADVARLAHHLMNPKWARSPDAERALDTASATLLYQTQSVLEWWSDSAETTTRVARRLVARPYDPNLSPDPLFARRVLSYSLAWRGHLQDAYRVWDGKRLAVLSQLALLGGVPRDTASAIFGRLLRTEPWPSPALVFALPWWSQTRDTISLNQVVTRVEKLGRSGSAHPTTRYLGEAASAYLALGRADTATALTLFLGLSHFQNYDAIGDWERYLAIRLLNSKARHREALQRLDQEVRSTALPFDVVVALERGRALEGLGDRDSAAAAYTEVSKAWAHADSAVQPMVTEARAALARLR